jgi:hypothetical protein
MSELTTIDTNNYAAMAQMMGMAYDTGEKKSSLARLRINKKSIMGDADVNGKTMKMEIVSAGAMGLQNTDNQVIYADKVVLRPFIQRFMYQRYDSNANNYQKTVMAEKLDIDLKDTTGTFNCGKPGGYIKDFDALPDGTKELIRQIRRVRVVFGTASMSGVTEQGDAQEVTDVPCVWEIDSKEGFKNVGQAFNKLGQMRRLPPQHNMTIETQGRELPTGSTFYVPVVNLDMQNNLEVTPEDQEVFKEFMAYVENFNVWVLSEWDKAAHGEPEEDEGVVGEFITVDVDDE